jgi:hypothetical protein
MTGRSAIREGAANPSHHDATTDHRSGSAVRQDFKPTGTFWGTQLLRLLVPASRTVDFRAQAGYAQPSENVWIVGSPHGNCGGGITCISSTTKQQPRRHDIARLEELLPPFQEKPDVRGAKDVRACSEGNCLDRTCRDGNRFDRSCSDRTSRSALRHFRR